MREWHERYKDDGLVVIGVHYPEFNHERDIENVKASLTQPGLEVPYPVPIDNEGETWRAYRNRFWPTLYFVDKTGQIRYVRIGEVRHGERTHQALEAIIQALLVEEESGGVSSGTG